MIDLSWLKALKDAIKETAASLTFAFVSFWIRLKTLSLIVLKIDKIYCSSELRF